MFRAASEEYSPPGSKYQNLASSTGPMSNLPGFSHRFQAYSRPSSGTATYPTYQQSSESWSSQYSQDSQYPAARSRTSLPPAHGFSGISAASQLSASEYSLHSFRYRIIDNRTSAEIQIHHQAGCHAYRVDCRVTGGARYGRAR